MIRVLLVARDSERLRRTGEALAGHSDIEIVGDVASLKDVMWVVSQLTPDVVVLMEMSGAPRSLMRLLRLNQVHRPGIQFLVWTQPGPGLAQAIKAGLSGYLLKDLGDQDLVGAIRIASQSAPDMRSSAEHGRRRSLHLWNRLPASP